MSLFSRTLRTLLCATFLTTAALAQRPDPATVEMTYRDKNDFTEALQPVPPKAIFRIPGYYLWDPSIIQVGNTYHLFTSR